MIKSILEGIFNKNIREKNRIKAESILSNDLIIDTNYKIEENNLKIQGRVLSHNFFSEYNCNIDIDLKSKSILNTKCTCEEYEVNINKKKDYKCCHLIAVFNYFIRISENDNYLINFYNNRRSTLEEEFDVLDYLIGIEEKKDMIVLQTFINKNTWNNSIYFNFRIGLKNKIEKTYVVKDIEQLMTAVHNGLVIEYGKDFKLDTGKQNFSSNYKRIIDFIDTIMEIERERGIYIKKHEKLVQGKNLKVPDYLFRSFLEALEDEKVYLEDGFANRLIPCKIVKGIPNEGIVLDIEDSNYLLTVIEDSPIILDEKGEVYLSKNTIYLPPYDVAEKLNKFYRVLNQQRVLKLPKSKEEIILRKLIPEIEEITDNFTIAKEIRDKILKGPASFKFYFDMDKKKLYLKVNVIYEGYEFNIFNDLKDKIIYRDIKLEKRVKSQLKILGLDIKDDKYIFIENDDYIYDFLKNKIHLLQEIGEVYYSENFKGIRKISKGEFKGEIKAGSHNYFKLDYEIKNINRDEIIRLLDSFTNKMRYYKLKNGEYIDLEDIEIKKYLSLMAFLAEDDYSFGSNKSIYINEYIKSNRLENIEIDEKFNNLISKFNLVREEEYEFPCDLKAELRPYQVQGYKWLKTLKDLGFGGILADEMGLGKTLQTIAFLQSERGSNALIVVPTSLVYNWKEEFEKFAPSLNIKVVNGDKSYREKEIKNIGEDTIVITSYNLLKRDYNEYEKINFDYYIIDEAQNIKNSNSETSKIVKKINSKIRFALTGTPMENSLMELWSIFDFIMPGYLGKENDFNVRYHRKLKEDKVILEEVHSLIKPFILKRLKKEVAKELPDKIEQKINISMTKEQEKVYELYSGYALDLINKKISKEEYNQSKIEILSYITKLRQIALDPSLVIDNYQGGSGKLEAAVEIIEESINEGHKILLFSQFTTALKKVNDILQNKNIETYYLDGGTKSKERLELVKKFNDSSNNIFLISLRAGGVGLNLATADVVIHLDPWWNPAVENQATDRAHRIGQKNVVEVMKFVSKGTLEEKIINMQEKKSKLINTILDPEVMESLNINKMDFEELKKLFERE